MSAVRMLVAILVIALLGVVPVSAQLQEGDPPSGEQGTAEWARVLQPDDNRLPSPPGSLPDAETTIDAALVWSALFDDSSTDTVMLGRDDLFADPLTSGSLQGLFDAPLLLTPTDALDERVATEITRLGASRVIIVGGPDALSGAVEDALTAAGLTVERAAGRTRIETAAAVAGEYFPDADTAFLVRADASATGGDPTQAWADSLSAGATAARFQYPILLTDTDGLTPATREYLEGSSITTVVTFGGEAAISAAVLSELDELGLELFPIPGITRADTAAITTFGSFAEERAQGVIILDGYAEDAWASGFAAASAAETSAVFLVNGPDVPPETAGAMHGYPFAPLCGPNVDATACTNAGTAMTVFTTGRAAVTGVASFDTVPGSPGPEGTTAGLRVFPTASADAFCYIYFTNGYGATPTSVVIQTGPPTETGETVFELQTGSNVDPEFGLFPGCIFDADATAVRMLLNLPEQHSVVMSDADHPDGFVAGSLFTEESIGGGPFSAEAVVSGSDAFAFGGVEFYHPLGDDDTLCYGFFVGLPGDEVTGMALYQGAPGEAGDLVLELSLEQAEIAVADRCLSVDPAVTQALRGDIEGHYVQVTSTAYADGAARAQLEPPFLPNAPTQTPADAETTLWRDSALDGANGIYVSPADGDVYVASVFGNEIAVLDSSTGTVVDRIGRERGVNGPDDLFITDDGTIYWTDILGGTVGRLTPDGETRTQFVGPGVNPITMSDDGRLFVGLIFLGAGIFELDPELIDDPEPVFADPTPVIGSNGFDFGPDGLLYLPLQFSSAVVRTDVLNRVPGTDPAVETVVDGLAVPTGVAFNSLGELHISDLAAGQVLKVDLATDDREIVAQIAGIVDNLAFSTDDQLFFAADADGQAMTVDGAGDVVALNEDGFTQPSTVTQTDDGTIWVADGGEMRGFADGATDPTSTFYFRFDPTGSAGANTVSALGDQLVTVGALTGVVQVFDPGTGAPVESNGPFQGVINAIAHGEDLVGAQLGGGVIDVRTGDVISDAFAYPLGMASDGTTLYVSDYALGTITAITDEGATVISEGFANPEGLALDGGRLLVVEEGTDQVSEIDLATGQHRPIITGLDLGPDFPTSDFSPPHNTQSGVTVAEDGTVYVTQDGDENGIVIGF